MPQGSTPLLAVERLSYHYREGTAERRVLYSVGLSLQPGERVALLGASGSGKSTLLNVIGTIDDAASGRVVIAGTDVTTLVEPERTLFRRRHLGFVYQRFHLLPTLTVEENVRLPLDLLGIARRERDAAVAHWLDAVGLGDRAGSFPDRLSGGEQQRVAIARALVHGPDLVLADEPTGSLDADTGDRVLELLLERVPETGGALLLVTHARQLADRMDRTLVLEAGRIRDCAGE